MKKILNEWRRFLLNEKSYNRIRHHIESTGVPFVMISAFRNERSTNENQALHKEMKADYQSAGFPFTEIRGGYSECPEGTEEIEGDERKCRDKETGEETEKIDVEEQSILIYDDTRPDIEKTRELFDLSIELSQKYGQDSFIYGQPEESEEGGQVYKRNPLTKERNIAMDIQAYNKDGSLIVADWAGPWNSVETAKAADVYWSKIYGRKWKLAEILDHYKNLKPQTMMEQQKRGWYIKAVRSALKDMK